MAHATVDDLTIAYEVIGEGRPWAITPGGRFSKDFPGVREPAQALAEAGNQVLDLRPAELRCLRRVLHRGVGVRLTHSQPYPRCMRRTQFTEEHDLFRDSFRTFVEREMVPHHLEWDEAGIVPRELFATAGAAGFLGMAVPGGARRRRRRRLPLQPGDQRGARSTRASPPPASGITLHNDICLPYFLSLATDEQRSRWLPGIASGELITAIAMTEPGIGSDLASMRTSAIRDGDHYVVNGAKTFITNGINADLVITAVKTDPVAAARGHEPARARTRHGRLRARPQPREDRPARAGHRRALLHRRARAGRQPARRRGQGLRAPRRQPPAGAALDRRRRRRRGRSRAALDARLRTAAHAFGQPIASFQNTRFELAEMRTEIDVAQVFVDRCVDALNDGELTVEEAAEAKWWCTELQKRTVDRCLQLHGGYGYMLEYPIARAYIDARVTTIYGGTTEIMKEIIGRKITRG